MRRTSLRAAGLGCALLLLFLGTANAADVFTLGTPAHLGKPGLRVLVPYAVLDDGTMWGYGTSSGSIAVGTSEKGVSRMVSTSWSGGEMRVGGAGVWASQYGSTYTRFSSSLMTVGYYNLSYSLSSLDFAADASGRLFVLASYWAGPPPGEPSYKMVVAGANGTDLGSWGVETTFPVAGYPVACCFDGSGRLCLLVIHYDNAYSVYAYDMSAGPANPAAPVEVATGDSATWNLGADPYNCTFRMQAGPDGATGSFVVGVSTYSASSVLLHVAPVGSSILRQTARSLMDTPILLPDKTRNCMWVITDNLMKLSQALALTGVGAQVGFPDPADGLGTVTSLSGATAGPAVWDAGNYRLAFYNSSGTVTGQYDGVLPNGPVAVSPDGSLAYGDWGNSGYLEEITLSTGTIRSLNVSLDSRPVVAGSHVWVLQGYGSSAQALCIVRATGAQARTPWSLSLSDEARDFTVAADESAVAVVYRDTRIKTYNASGTQQGDFAVPGFYKIRFIACPGGGQVVAAVTRTDDENAPPEVLGYSLAGQSLWRVALPASLPANPWLAPWLLYGEGDAPIGGIASDPTGQHLYVADNVRGVIHHLVRQTVAPTITDVWPAASGRQRAVTVHVWGAGLPTSGTVQLKQGSTTINLTSVIFDGQAHLYGVVDLSAAAPGWWDMVVAPGAGQVLSANAVLVAADYPPSLMGAWRLDSFGPPGQLQTVAEERLLTISDQGDYAWDRPALSGEEESAWVGKLAAWSQYLAVLNLDGLRRYRFVYSTAADHLHLEQQTGTGAPRVFEFSRKAQDIVLSDEQVGTWKLVGYNGVMPAEATVTWNQTMSIWRDGNCRMDSDRATGPWWRVGRMILAGATNGAALFDTNSASNPDWVGRVWAGTWGWGAGDLMLNWQDEAGHTWSEHWQKTGGVPSGSLITVALEGPKTLPAGGGGTYKVKCKNVGTVDVGSFTISLSAPWLNGGTPLIISPAVTLAAGAEKEVTQAVTVPSVTTPGPTVLEAIAAWQTPTTGEQRARMNVLITQPYLDIGVYESAPVFVRPGDSFSWVVTVVNKGSDLSLIVPASWDSETAVHKAWNLATGFSMTGFPAQGAHVGSVWTLTWADLKSLIPISGNSASFTFTVSTAGDAYPHTTASASVGVLMGGSAPGDPVDAYPPDNADTVNTEVRTAWDPNAIYVDPDHTGPGGKLHYVVTFENEGNDVASRVRVDLVLHPLLDPATLKLDTPGDLPGGATYSGTYDSGTRTIHWEFNNLNLQEKEERSVTFSISVRSDADFGSLDTLTVTQDASIIFEDLAAIVTSPAAVVTVARPSGDVDGNGAPAPDMADFRAFMQEWRTKAHTPYYPSTQGAETTNADLNRDGRLDFRDVSMMLEMAKQKGLVP